LSDQTGQNQEQIVKKNKSKRVSAGYSLLGRKWGGNGKERAAPRKMLKAAYLSSLGKKKKEGQSRRDRQN